MRLLARLLTISLALAALSSNAFCDAGNLSGRVYEKKLSNGLVALALPRAGAPVVTLQMTFKVGSVDEPEGAKGVAHLLEHMLFKGTKTLGTSDWEGEKPLLDEIEAVGKALDSEKRKGDEADAPRIIILEERLKELEGLQAPFVVKDETDAVYSRNGGTGFNAFTTSDLTSYIVSLPSNRLELWAAIESERMREPVFRGYFNERKVVIQERLQRRDSEPSVLLFEGLFDAAFKIHPYRYPVIGKPEDFGTLDIDVTRSFFEKHYGPDNAVAVAVGDFDPEVFFALLERYFGDIPPRGGAFPPIPKEPLQEGQRRVEVFSDAEPMAVIAFHKPTLPDRDDYVLDLVDGILSGGRSSRLWRELVENKKVATQVSTVNGSPGARYDNLFVVYVEPAPGVEPETALEAVREELRRLAGEPPPPAELEKVKRALEADRVRGLLSDGGLSRRLSFFQTVAGDWRYIEEHPKVMETITPEEVSKVAARYFTPENETTAILRRPAQKAGEAGK
ncbi:insulinase family protein [bacterium]|nr:MAG: insulinase family protein [bacterium]